MRLTHMLLLVVNDFGMETVVVDEPGPFFGEWLHNQPLFRRFLRLDHDICDWRLRHQLLLPSEAAD